MRITAENMADVKSIVVGCEYVESANVLAQFDWQGYYPVVEDGRIVDVVPADAAYEIVDDAYMAARN